MRGKGGTKPKALIYHEYECKDGPLIGSKLVLSEEAPNTAWLQVGRAVGRYMRREEFRTIPNLGEVRWGRGALYWEERKINRHARKKKHA